MALSVFMLAGGFHAGTWRKENSRAEEIGLLDFVVELTRTAEAAKLDAVFFGDALYPGDVPGPNPTLTAYEPIGTLGALAATTSKIGLVGTISNSFSELYNVARQLTNLDNLSGGRIGWNVVTSWAGNKNFGPDEHSSFTAGIPGARAGRFIGNRNDARSVYWRADLHGTADPRCALSPES